ncbi:DNA repair protein RecN [Haloechinothrix sp. LS1_15]|nr:DNA repair protein RecN [Haloechinothrix sp. LS1_15]
MRINGIGVIDDALLELDSRFTVVTGETGAGKTMVVTGLHLLSGGRSDASRIRAGATKAAVEGRFALDRADGAAEVISQAGADTDEDGSVIAVRTVNAEGRSRAYLGGRSVPVGVLSQLAEELIAVHGQHDQLRLMRSAEQRAVLDRFAGQAVADPLAEYQRVRAEWREVAAELADRTERSRELAQQADMLRHGLSEIESVEPQPGEDGEVAERIKRLTEVDELRTVAGAAQQALSGSAEGDPDQPGALGLIGEARRRLAGSTDPALAELEPRLAQVNTLLSDIGSELGSYLDGLDADPAELDRLLNRQAELKKLTRKYAADIDGVLAWAEDARARLASMDTSEEALAQLAARRDELAGELAEHAARLSQARIEAAARLAEATSAELGGLAMPQARLEVAVRRRQIDGTDDAAALDVEGQRCHAGADGIDEVEFRLRAHQDGPALPLHKAASGGELSRVMLAIEVVLAGADTVPTLVFDEVDAGVGGRAAVEIGRRLAKLAASHQVIVVTHLPQVAAYADRHLVVDRAGEATSDGGITSSCVRTLDSTERVGELARMLAGMDGTETGRAHAEELLTVAEKEKSTRDGA